MHFLRRAVRKVASTAFGKKLGKKITKWTVNPFRAAQRSHRLGHTLATSMSNQNQITRAYNKLVSQMGKSALRAAERQSAHMVGNSGSSARVALPQQRLDYSYRRLSDLI